LCLPTWLRVQRVNSTKMVKDAGEVKFISQWRP
jgi:hypothetical protein